MAGCFNRNDVVIWPMRMVSLPVSAMVQDKTKVTMTD